MARVRNFIENQFGVVLVCAFLIGLFMPGMEQVPPFIVPYVLAVIIFFSCSKIHLEDIQKVRVHEVTGFYILRFLIFPVLVFYTASLIVPEYRFALLMLALLPCGSTLPAITHVMGGNPALGLGATVISGAMAPLMIPFGFILFSDADVRPDPIGMFQTLALIIFLPVAVYFLIFKRIKPAQSFISQNASIVAVLFIGFIAATIIASQRERFFADPAFLFEAVIVGAVFYCLLYAMGWGGFHHKPYRARVSFALMSGNNNIALGISLAFLYLPDQETMMLVMFEIPWVLGLSAFQFYIKFHKASLAGKVLE